MIPLKKFEIRSTSPIRCFGGGGGVPAQPAPVNIAGENANAALAAATASQEERARLKRERGAAATMLTGPHGSVPGGTKKTLLGE